ncbi:MAG: hypothetical protein KAT65_07975 [Methanophagales archaeon]|nr:hypothetical protein [Methanophagales archaeon]
MVKINKTKIVVLTVLLFVIPILKGIVTVPSGLEPYETSVFLAEIGNYWIENIERLIGAIVGIF